MLRVACGHYKQSSLKKYSLTGFFLSQSQCLKSDFPTKKKQGNPALILTLIMDPILLFNCLIVPAEFVFFYSYDVGILFFS